jgi:hypothetical protein
MIEMERKKCILLVSSAFYPEISPRSFRATELAKEFFRQGHSVVVISKFRDYDYTDFLNEFNVTLKMWSKPHFVKIPEFRRNPLSIICRVVSRLMRTVFEYPGIEEMFKVRKLLKNESLYDLMISFAVPYPIHWGTAWSRSKKNKIAKVWVADCGDPYMGDVLDSFRKPFYFRYLEKWFCRKAEFITIPVENAISGYYPEFHYKMRVIPQGFDFDISKTVANHHENAIPTFAYAGGFLPGARDPRPFLKYLETVEMPFRFLVFTNNSDLISDYIEKLNGKLVISNYIPRPTLIKILPEMDFLINFDNNTLLNSPSKLIDYAIVGRPVLNISNTFYPENVQAFLKADYRNKMSLPDPERYHIRNVSMLFLNLLAE